MVREEDESYSELSSHTHVHTNNHTLFFWRAYAWTPSHSHTHARTHICIRFTFSVFYFTSDGMVTNKIVALPCRFRRLGISLVEGLEGGSEGQDTLKELITSYVQATKGVSPRQDPFMKGNYLLCYLYDWATLTRELQKQRQRE